jgi:hypothetical protein
VVLVAEEELAEVMNKESGDLDVLKKGADDSSRWQVMVEHKRMPALNGDGQYSLPQYSSGYYIVSFTIIM